MQTTANRTTLVAKTTKVKFARGNKKLPDSTFILNMNSATDCPSLKLGMCQCPSSGKGSCYAMKPEIQYPNALKSRREQARIWKKLSAREIATQLLDASHRARKNKMKAFRFSEAGDFDSQDDVDKMSEVCAILSEAGVKCYGYTARKDLDYSELKLFASVQGSGFMVTNEFRLLKTQAEADSFKGLICPADCRTCSACVVAKGIVIGVKGH